ncbi:MAG: UDP-N-acetylmuramoyl-L-alanine--D-glutamate ligase [Proteobacteria bacterium]|nr:UDP-N-acetylmuramoyl-L-alanine--D-glutamate ligase [Pseudomonadota bacterium]
MVMRTAIVGLGVTGYSCLKHLHASDNLVVIDTRAAPPFLDDAMLNYSNVEYLLGINRFDFSGVDRIVVSPGIALDACLLEPALKQGIPLVSDIDLFFDAVTQPVYGITGTNGKSTVTAMLGHLKNSLGRNAPAGGNLGDAALDIIDPLADCYVIELSSFQLERMAHQHFEASTILNLSEDHLDRHGDMSRYQGAKQRIYADTGLAVFNRQDPLTPPRLNQAGAKNQPARTVSFGAHAPARPADWGVGLRDGKRVLLCGDEIVMGVDQMPVSGLHNEQNVLAAFALSGEDPYLLADAIANYQGLAHRSELVAVRRGVRFINDSKATNVGAALAALHGLGTRPANIHLIAGGDGKGASFSPLHDAVRDFVVKAYLVGRDARLLAEALPADTSVCFCTTVDEAVVQAAADARSGTIVLLSPACASLDMFPNYRVRGEVFRAAVDSLS